MAALLEYYMLSFQIVKIFSCMMTLAVFLTSHSYLILFLPTNNRIILMIYVKSKIQGYFRRWVPENLLCEKVSYRTYLYNIDAHKRYLIP